MVSVGTVLTSDEMSELQKRETEDLAAIQALQAVISASDAVIKPQQALITQDGIKIWIYKILLATGIIYIIYLLL